MPLLLFLCLNILIVAGQVEDGFETENSDRFSMLRQDFDRTWNYSAPEFLRNDLVMLYDLEEGPCPLNLLITWHLEELGKRNVPDDVKSLHSILWERGARPVSLSNEIRQSLAKIPELSLDTALLAYLFDLGLEQNFLIDEGLRIRFPANLVGLDGALPVWLWAHRRGISLQHPYRNDPLDLTFKPLVAKLAELHRAEELDKLLTETLVVWASESIRYKGSEFAFYLSPATAAIQTWTPELTDQVLQTLGVLRKHGVNIIIPDYTGRTAYDYALETGDQTLIAYMLSWQLAEEHTYDVHNEPLLGMLESYKGDRPDTLHIGSKFGRFPLIYMAIWYNDVNLARALFKAGVDPLSRYGDYSPIFSGLSPLYYLYLSEEDRLYESIALIPESEEMEFQLSRILFKVATYPTMWFYGYYGDDFRPPVWDFDRVNMLLEVGAEPDLDNILYKCVKSSQPELVKFWLEYSDWAYRDLYLELAEKGLINGVPATDSCVAMLIRTGVDPAFHVDWRGKNLFTMALEGMHTETVRAMLEQRPSLITDEVWIGRKDQQVIQNPLNMIFGSLPQRSFAYTETSEEEMLQSLPAWKAMNQLLISYGADPDLVDHSGVSPRQRLREYDYLPEAFFQVWE